MKPLALTGIVLLSLLLITACAQSQARKERLYGDTNTPQQSQAGDLTCSTVTNQTERTTCIADLALSIKNNALCANAPDADTCYLNYAINTHDAATCSLIKNPGAKTICGFSTQKKNT